MEAPVSPLQTPLDSGRHIVTLLFADLSRSTPLAAAMEAEHYAALLTELRHAYDDVVPAHGGQVVRVQGDGVLAMFGFPVPREDDARRAVEAAVALHQRVAALPLALPPGFALSLHSGVHGGIVLIAAGDIERGRFELLGPVPHIAARLSDRAAPHEVLVSQETLGPAARHFQTSEPQQLQLRGRAEPLAVLSIQTRADGADPGATPAPAAAAVNKTELIGREAELHQLQAALHQAFDGPPRVLAVSGAPGLGKTFLVQALVEQAGAWRLLRGHCDPGLDAEAMQPFAQMLRALGQPVEAKVAQAVAAMSAQVAALAEAQPLLMVIDDWQWADDASHLVLHALRRLPAARLLVLLTTRPQDAAAGGGGAHAVIDLQPLSAADSLRLAEARLPGVDPFVIAEVCRHAGGNPLFLGELCQSVRRAGRARGRSLRAGDVAESLGLGRQAGTAAWLGHLVLSRLRDLPPEQVELAQAAAIVGNVVPEWLLEHLSGHRADSPAVRALADADLLYAGDEAQTLRFKHGLMRDVIYAGIGLHARQLLHLRVAAALQQRLREDEHPELLQALAYHFGAGGEPTLTAHYAEQAGNRALAASALDRARALYRSALDALDQLAPSPVRALRWIDIVHQRCLVSVFDPTRDDLALVQRALNLAEQQADPVVTSRARYWLSYIHYALGEASAAVLHGEQALAEARAAGDGPLATQIIATLGEAHTTAAQYPQALQRLDEAIAIKRAHRSGRRVNVGLAFSLVCRACVVADRGDFAAALLLFDEAADCIGNVNHQIGATVAGWRAAVLLWRGDWEQALVAAEASRHIAQATHSLSQYSIAHALHGYARWRRDDEAAGLAAVEEATAWLTPHDNGIYRSLNHGWLAEGLLGTARRDVGRHHAALALQRARRGDQIGGAMCRRALALDAAQRGRFDEADRQLAHADAVAAQRESAHEAALNLLARARAAQWRDQAAQAGAWYGRADAQLLTLGMIGHRRRLQQWRDGGVDVAQPVPAPVTATATADTAAPSASRASSS